MNFPDNANIDIISIKDILRISITPNMLLEKETPIQIGGGLKYPHETKIGKLQPHVAQHPKPYSAKKMAQRARIPGSVVSPEIYNRRSTL